MGLAKSVLPQHKFAEAPHNHQLPPLLLVPLGRGHGGNMGPVVVPIQQRTWKEGPPAVGRAGSAESAPGKEDNRDRVGKVRGWDQEFAVHIGSALLALSAVVAAMMLLRKWKMAEGTEKEELNGVNTWKKGSEVAA